MVREWRMEGGWGEAWWGMAREMVAVGSRLAYELRLDSTFLLRERLWPPRADQEGPGRVIERKDTGMREEEALGGGNAP